MKNTFSSSFGTPPPPSRCKGIVSILILLQLMHHVVAMAFRFYRPVAPHVFLSQYDFALIP